MGSTEGVKVEPLKGVTAWEVEPGEENGEENGDEFFVLTFHHGLGRKTRLDLGGEDLRDIARMLMAAADGND